MRILTLVFSSALSSVFFMAPASFAETKSDKSDDIQIESLEDIRLPTHDEIDEFLNEIPDFNAVLGDFLDFAKDEDRQASVKKSGEVFVQKLEDSGALEPDRHGLPDINKAMSVMLHTFADEEVGGTLLGTLKDFVEIMEKHIPEDDEATDLEPTDRVAPKKP